MKRGYSTQEAMKYLGVKRRFFETYIGSVLKDKTVKAGSSTIYEQADLDAAWERYKIMLGSERSDQKMEKEKWDVQVERQVSIKPRKAVMKLTPGITNGEFANVALQVFSRRKTT